MTTSYIIFITFFMFSGLLGLYAMFIEPFSLRVTKHKIISKKWTNTSPIKIALLADPHMIGPWMTKAHLQKIVDRTNQLDVDLILLLGDYVGDHPFGKQLNPYEAIKPFENLKANCGVFAVLGNHDMRHKDIHIGSWPDAMRKSSVPVLDNDSVKIQCHGENVWISGIEDWWYGKPDIDKALSKTDHDSPIIMLTHNPDAFPWMPKNITATFAGHTHAGQIRFPFIGALSAVVPSKYGDKYAYGHHHENGKDLVVSAGLGMTGIPLRFLNKPEITVVTIEGPHE